MTKHEARAFRWIGEHPQRRDQPVRLGSLPRRRVGSNRAPRVLAAIRDCRQPQTGSPFDFAQGRALRSPDFLAALYAFGFFRSLDEVVALPD